MTRSSKPYKHLLATRSQRLIIDPDRTWFTGDTHIGHDPIRRHCKRPFGDVETMNGHILDHLRRAVRPGDLLIHLGDVSFKSNRTELVGDDVYRILIRGNHDARGNRIRGWDVVMESLELAVGTKSGPKIILSHYPFREWNGFFHGSYHFHGHTHNRVSPLVTEHGGRIDVGVDAWQFRPLRFVDAQKKLATLRKRGEHMYC